MAAYACTVGMIPHILQRIHQILRRIQELQQEIIRYLSIEFTLKRIPKPKLITRKTVNRDLNEQGIYN